MSERLKYTTSSGFLLPALLLALMALSSCRTLRNLDEGQALVTRAGVTLEQGDEPISNKATLKYELSTLIRQQPNEKIFGFLTRTRLWAHYQTDAESDTSVIDNWMRKNLAEPPAIYDREVTLETAASMVNYLNNLGYWKARVELDTMQRRRKMGVNYVVSPGNRFFYGQVRLKSSDPSVQRILNQTLDQSILQPGSPISSASYSQEVNRIVRTMRDSGYAFFNSSYVDQLEIDVNDTTGNTVRGTLTVYPREDGSPHIRYRTGQIRVYPDFDPGQNVPSLYKSQYEYIDFYSPERSLSIRPSVLLQQMYLREDSPYGFFQLEKTNQQLGRLDMYRFISVSPRRDTAEADLLHFDIELIPKQRWSIGYDIELNTSSSSLNSNALIGGSVNLSLLNRNLFKGGEMLTANANLGVEFPRRLTGLNTIVSALNFELNTGITFPVYIDPFGLSRIVGGLRMYRRSFRDILRENTQSQLKLGYNYVLLNNFYEYNQLNGSFGYETRPSASSSIQYTPIGIDYLQFNPFENFFEVLQQNPFLIRSFTEQQLFTGFLLRSVDYSWRTKSRGKGSSWQFRSRLEMSGWEVLGINALANAVQSTPDTFRIGGVPFSHYAIADLDGRLISPLSKHETFALRIAIGAGLPFGYSPEVPYVKQFFVGGPTSIRAWQIREIGPGGYYDEFANMQDNLIFYQTGDMRMEFSMEYRFDLFWYFEGALFLDGGNVWTLREDPDRPGSQFLWRNSPLYNDSGVIIADHFLNQIALGFGAGLRMDLSYFIIRLDAGYPLRNPYPKQEAPRLNSYWNVGSLRELTTADLNFNLAIGYPF